MTSAFDSRLVSVTLQLLSGTFTFKDLAIFARGESFASAQMGQCEVQIFNMTEAQKNQVLSQASPMLLGQVNSANGQRVPVNMTLQVGRQSYGLFTLFQGNVISCGATQPPDIGVTLRGMTSNYLASVIAGVNQSSLAQLSSICKGVADSLGLGLEFTATDRQIDNWNFNGGLINQVDQLNDIGGIYAYIPSDSAILVVHDSDGSRKLPTILIDAIGGMVGVPQVTEVGVLVRVMVLPSLKLGGMFQVQSVINPSANGLYFLYKITYEIANRDTPFWYVLEGRNPSYVPGTVQ